MGALAGSVLECPSRSTYITRVAFCDLCASEVQLLDLSEPGSGALASGGRGSGRLFRMGDFIDTTNIEGRFEFSEFVRAYGKYLDEQLAVVAQCGWYQARRTAQCLEKCRAGTAMVAVWQTCRLPSRALQVRPLLRVRT